MSQQAETEADLTRDAFYMWFAEKKYPQELRGLLWDAWVDAWLQGQERGLMCGINAASKATDQAIRNVFRPKP